MRQSMRGLLWYVRSQAPLLCALFIWLRPQLASDIWRRLIQCLVASATEMIFRSSAPSFTSSKICLTGSSPTSSAIESS